MHPPYLNDYYRRAARRETIDVPGQEITILDFDAQSGVPWQAWVFNAQDATGPVDVIFELRGGYATDGEIRISIPPGGGDLITGTGACTVSGIVRGAGLVGDVSVWFVPEQTVRALPPFADRRNLTGVAPQTVSIGSPPFGRYKCTVVSPSGYTLELRDLTGGVLFTQAFTGGALAFDNSYFYWPPNTELFLTSTVNNQRINISVFQ
jgi:hypothetical protein